MTLRRHGRFTHLLVPCCSMAICSTDCCTVMPMNFGWPEVRKKITHKFQLRNCKISLFPSDLLWIPFPFAPCSPISCSFYVSSSIFHTPISCIAGVDSLLKEKKTATNVSHAVKKNRILAKALINIIYNDVSGCLAKHLSNIFFDIKF